jgi:hypothetical protein
MRPRDQFEAQVFRFLVTYHQELGLREVHRLQNQLIDGALVLTNGARVALEVKYRLGWDTRGCDRGVTAICDTGGATADQEQPRMKP